MLYRPLPGYLAVTRHVIVWNVYLHRVLRRMRLFDAVDRNGENVARRWYQLERLVYHGRNVRNNKKGIAGERHLDTRRQLINAKSVYLRRTMNDNRIIPARVVTATVVRITT